MTRVRGTDKLDPPSTYQRIIERGPWASYARCDECGVDAGKACRDMDDCEALEVCDGRRLSIDDSAARCRVAKHETETQRDKPQPTPPAEPEPKPEPKGPPMGSCACCGVPVRLPYRGCIYVSCKRPECATVVKRMRWQRDHSRYRNQDPVPCWWCGVMLPAHGRRGDKKACCGDLICRRATAREHRRKAKSAASQRADPLAAE